MVLWQFVELIVGPSKLSKVASANDCLGQTWSKVWRTTLAITAPIAGRYDSRPSDILHNNIMTLDGYVSFHSVKSLVMSRNLAGKFYKEEFEERLRLKTSSVFRVS
jgi:hypothetical protein